MAANELSILIRMRQAGQEAALRTIATLDQIKKAAGQIQGAFAAILAPIKRIASGLLNVKTALLGLAGVGSMGLLARDMVKTGSSFEDFKTSLETVLGSSKKAEKAMKWITDFSSKTPFEIADVTASFTSLAARGFDGTKVLKTLGDTAAGMGKPLREAVEAFASAATGEFERLKLFGITAQTAGDQVTFSWIQNGQTMTKSIRKTQDEIAAALTEIWRGKFKGGMERFSGTWTGMWSNLKDQITLFKQAVMDSGLFEYLKGQLRALLDWIDRLGKEGTLAVWAKSISGFFVSVLERVKAFVAWVSEHWSEISAAFTTTGQIVVKAVGLMIQALGSLVPAAGIAVEAISKGFSFLAAMASTALGLIEKLILLPTKIPIIGKYIEVDKDVLDGIHEAREWIDKLGTSAFQIGEGAAAAQPKLENLGYAAFQIGEKISSLGMAKAATKTADALKTVAEQAEETGDQLVLVNGVWTNVATSAKKVQESPPRVTVDDSQALDALDRIRSEIESIPKEVTTRHVIEEVTLAAKRWGGRIEQFARGGWLSGWGGGDRIRALLEPGEFVIRKEAVRRYGAGLFDLLNRMRLDLPQILTAGLPAVPQRAYAGGGEVLEVRFAAGGKVYPVRVASRQDLATIRDLAQDLNRGEYGPPY
jgi:hypothetical protein